MCHTNREKPLSNKKWTQNRKLLSCGMWMELYSIDYLYKLTVKL